MFYGIPVADAGGWVLFIALAGVLIRALITGQLVPRKTHEDQIERANQWMAESRIKDQQIHELNDQNHALLREFGPTAVAVLDALRNHVGDNHESDERAVR